MNETMPEFFLIISGTGGGMTAETDWKNSGLSLHIKNMG